MESPRALVVEDDPSVRALFADALARVFDVEAVGDAHAALRVLEGARFACVVADQGLPGMTGVELFENLRALQPQAGRVLVTGSVHVEDLVDAVHRGRVHRFVCKPVRRTVLIEAAEEAARAASLEEENLRLLSELRDKNALLAAALAAVRDSERRLEDEVRERTAALEAANAELSRLAVRDGLTGLYNHRFFQEALGNELARAARYRTPVSLLFLDVDWFKNYNDVCGHPAGDALLRALAQLLQADRPSARGRQSDLVARYGGEEFVVMLPHTDLSGARVRAEALRSAIAEHPFPRREVQPSGRVTVSVGVATYPEDARDQPSLIEAADRALLAAKRAGRDRVMVASSLVQGAPARP